MIKTVKDIDLTGKRIVMRVDFNVPMKDGVVQYYTRIMSELPTIKYILEQKPRSLVLMSHLGDPKKDVKKAQEKAEKAGKTWTDADTENFINGKNRMAPVVKYFAEKLGQEVKFLPDALGQKAAVDALPEGGVAMLENTRFHKEETSKDAAERDVMAKELASYGDIFVNDAFGTAHRDQASTASIAKFVKVKVGGFLMEKEVKYIEPMVTNPAKPMIAIIGGAKVSSKIAVLESLLKNASALIIGGGMAYTFLKAQGHTIGKSLVEDDFIQTAKDLLAKAAEKKVRIVLPVDHIGAESFGADAAAVAVNDIDIPDNLMGMDVGPKTLDIYKKEILGAKSIVWNGPVGVFEFENFAHGTGEIAKYVAEATQKNGAYSLVGGGDSVAAVNKFGLADKVSYVSTGGGAMLEAIEGKTLPGVAAIKGE